MGAAFWIRRFILVWTAAFVLIAGAQALKGRATSPTQRSAALVASGHRREPVGAVHRRPAVRGGTVADLAVIVFAPSP